MQIPHKFGRTTIISLGYKAKSGKGTLARYIRDEFPEYTIKIYSFAYHLKIELFETIFDANNRSWEAIAIEHDIAPFALPQPIPTGLSEIEKFKWIEKHKDFYRKHLQIYGTEYMRYQDEWHWVRKTALDIERDAPQFALIEDMRFWNEAIWTRASDGYNVKVVRPNNKYKLAEGHSSECELDRWDFDATVINDAGHRELRLAARELFGAILRAKNPCHIIGGAGVTIQEAA